MEKVRYFLGANSPTGFCGCFRQAYQNDWHVWLLKGGPGTGKSTLLHRVAEAVGGEWEYVHCSSDPKSLDAVLSTERRVMVADATAPHTMDAVYPGCVEHILDLGQGFDLLSLRSEREEVIALTAQNAACHRYAVHYLGAAAELVRIQNEYGRERLDVSRAERLADEWKNRLWPTLRGEQHEDQRGLCAVTPDGVLFYQSTVCALADTIQVLKDDWGSAAPVFLDRLRADLHGCGCRLIVCRCSLFPRQKTEHVLLPEQHMAFVTSNHIHAFTAALGHELVLDECYAPEAAEEKTLLCTLYRQQEGMLRSASEWMQRARVIHDELEKHYIHAMNFEFAQEKALELAQEITRLTD